MEKRFKENIISAIVLLALCPLALGAMQQSSVQPSLLQRERLETTQTWSNVDQYGSTDGNVSLGEVDDTVVSQQLDEIGDSTVRLRNAITTKNLELVKKLVEDELADVNARDDGPSPLSLAIKSGDLDIFKYLVEKGANITSEGWYALHAAAEYGRLGMVKYLIEKQGANVNEKNYLEYVPFNLAVQSGNFELVKYLAEKGANVNEKNPELIGPEPPSYGFSAIQIAINSDSLEIIKYLVEKKGANVNERTYYGLTPLMLAAQNGKKVEIVKYLIEKGADVNATVNYYSPLEAASANGHLDVVIYLVKNGANVNLKDANNETALFAAAEYNHLEIVKYLIAQGANIEENVLHVASQKGYLEIVKYLIANGANVNLKDANNETALFAAAKDNHLEIVKYLIANGADVNIQNLLGYTALLLAAENGYLEIVKYLIENGAKINIQNMLGKTALILAASRGYLEIVKYLIQKRANINATTVGTNITALDLASGNGYLDIVQYLVDHGAKINIKTNFHETALDFASVGGHLDVVIYLVKRGAKINATTVGNNLTTLDLASVYGHPDVVKYLELVEDFYKVVADKIDLNSFIDKYLSPYLAEQDKALLNKNFTYIRGLLHFGDKAMADGLYKWYQKNGVSLQSAKSDRWDWGLPGMYLEFLKNAFTPEQTFYWYNLAKNDEPKDTSNSSTEFRSDLEKTLNRPENEQLRKELTKLSYKLKEVYPSQEQPVKNSEFKKKYGLEDIKIQFKK